MLHSIATDYGHIHGDAGLARTGIFRHRGKPYLYDLWAIQRDDNGRPTRYRLDLIEANRRADDSLQQFPRCIFHQP